VFFWLCSLGWFWRKSDLQPIQTGFKIDIPSLEKHVFSSGTIVLVKGLPGAGKSAFAHHLIRDGFKVGHRGILAITDTAADAIRKKNVWLSETGRLDVLDFLLEKPHSLADVATASHMVIEKAAGVPIIFLLDSISTLGILFNPELLAAWLLEQRAWMAKQNAKILNIIIYHEGIHPPSITNALQAISGVVVEMETAVLDGELQSMIRIPSIGEAPHSAKWYPFKIRDEGISFGAWCTVTPIKRA
jgi:KaiC/GvpD/RAD55 family RecA-like ATPase